MKKTLNRIFENETLSYLFFGVAAMLLSILVRTIIFTLTQNATLATTIADILAIIFAFYTNDRFVFKQVTKGWPQRFVKFALGRAVTFFLNIGLSNIFVDTYPQIIGQFVNHDLETVNLIETIIAQVLIIVLNYILSKFIVFRSQKKN